MIPFQEILKHAKYFPPEIIEKDYCITWLLWGLSQSSLAKELVFYGGTALKKIYFPGFRFSEDLDFLSERNLSQKQILSSFESIYGALRKEVNINYYTKENSLASKDDRVQFFVGYDGFPEINTDKQIKLDLCLNQPVLGKAIAGHVLSSYSDWKKTNGILPAYSLEALTAEKISAIFDSTRKEPRDLYDLNYLLKQKLDRDSILRLLKKKWGYIPSLSSVLSNIDSEIYRNRWQIRLNNQVEKLDKFEPFIRGLASRLKRFYSK